jgi:transposase
MNIIVAWIDFPVKGDAMLSEPDYLEAMRRYKNKKLKGHERQRYHALLLVTKGYSYRETADILFVDEETISRWVEFYQERGLDGLKNHPCWGGEHGQRRLKEAELGELSKLLEQEAMPGTEVGSGWTIKAIRMLIEERFNIGYSRRGVRKLMRALKWSYQRGRKLYIKRSEAEQLRFECETVEVLAELASSGERVTPLAGDQSKVYLEGTIARRWNPVGKQPRIGDGARSKSAENIYGAIHLGTGEEVVPFVIDWQDSDATICWLEQLLIACPRGKIILWIDRAPHHTSDEVEEWLEAHQRLRVVHFPAYTPEENPKEATWKTLKEEVSHHCWHETKEDLSKAIDGFYQTARKHTVSFLEKFGYFWCDGRIHPLPQAS